MPPPPNVHLFIFWIILSKINQFNNFWYVKFGTTKFDVKILPTCPPHPSDIATLPREIQKRSFFNNIYPILQIINATSEETNSNCCTAALVVYLLLFSASYYLHSPISLLRLGHAMGGARVLMIWTDQCRKRLEACINAKGGRSEHLL